MRFQGLTGESQPGARNLGAALALLAAVAACATSPPQEEIPAAEVYYQRGLETLKGRRILLFFRDVDYPKAIELFQEVIDNYPYSEYATLAELKIADIYFEQEKYDEAAGYYQDFVELHPSNPQVDYAIFRNGLCSYQRLRAADRDQTATRDAIAQFRVLLERYPDSQYAEAAQDMIARSEDLLAAHDVEVGNYYLRRQECYAAARRFENALLSYPRHRERHATMVHLARALRCLGRDEESVALYRQVLQEGANGDLAADVREELEELGVPAP